MVELPIELLPMTVKENCPLVNCYPGLPWGVLKEFLGEDVLLEPRNPWLSLYKT